jgi:DNA mismatch repair protein MutL
MKFLKRDTTESNAISGLLDRMALSHPEISFNFIRDGKQEFLTLGDGKLQSNIYIIYGKEAASSMITVKYKLGEILVSGAVSKPAYARPNRNMQHFFINGRYIKNITLASAVESAFRGYLMVKKFPVCVLHLSIPYDSVDVNIHPAKTEVKFLDDKSMFNAVYSAIKLALNAQDSYKIMKIKQDDLEQEQKLKLSDKSESKVGDKTLPSINGRVNRVEENAGKLSVNFDKPVRLKDNQDSAAINWVSKSRNEEDDRSIEISIPNVFGSIKDNYNKGELKRKIEIKENSELSHSVESDNKEQFFQNSKQPNFMAKTEPIDEEDTAILEDQMKVISEIFGTYILLEHKHELILVDKHAAHERILYEKLKKCSVKNLSQVLLSSMLTTLEKEEYAVLIENLSLLSEVGFDLEDFGSGTVLIRAIPMFLEIGEAKDTILEIAGKLMKNQSNFNIDKLDWIYHNVACRSAIKAGDKTKKEELLALIEELQQSPELKYCPHGRPIFISLKKSEIEKQFGRKK